MHDNLNLSEFPLEKTTSNFRDASVLPSWKNFFRRPTIRSGVARDPRGTFRNPQFASFLSQTNRKSLDTDFQDTVLRGRKFVRHALKLLVAGGLAWVVIESARALTVF